MPLLKVIVFLSLLILFIACGPLVRNIIGGLRWFKLLR